MYHLDQTAWHTKFGHFPGVKTGDADMTENSGNDLEKAQAMELITVQQHCCIPIYWGIKDSDL
jgi:hypothetical protein